VPDLRPDVYIADVPRGRRAPMGYRFVPDCDLDREAFPSVMCKVIEAERQNATSPRKRGVGRGVKVTGTGFPGPGQIGILRRRFERLSLRARRRDPRL
jgi:hypothetical protein